MSGNVLYRFNTSGSIGGGIVTYEIDGKQYVGIMSSRPSGSWIDKNPGTPTVFQFSLPQASYEAPRKLRAHSLVIILGEENQAWWRHHRLAPGWRASRK
jgi:hypothetical protein